MQCRPSLGLAKQRGDGGKRKQRQQKVKVSKKRLDDRRKTTSHQSSRPECSRRWRYWPSPVGAVRSGRRRLAASSIPTRKRDRRSCERLESKNKHVSRVINDTLPPSSIVYRQPRVSNTKHTDKHTKANKTTTRTKNKIKTRKWQNQNKRGPKLKQWKLSLSIHWLTL